MTSRETSISIVLAIATFSLNLFLFSSCYRANNDLQRSKMIFYSDSVLTMKGDSIVEVVTASPDNYVISVVANDDSLQDREIICWLACGLIVLAIGGIIVLIHSHSKHRTIKQLIAQLEAKTITIEDMKEELEILGSKSDTISKTLNMILKQNIETIKRLNGEREVLNKKENSEFYPDKLEELQGKVDIIRLEMDRLHNKIPLQKNLEDTLDSTCGNIMKRVREAFGNSLKESDYQILTGVFAGLSSNEISFITGLSPGTIRVRKSRLKTRIQALPGSKDKEDFLHYFDQQRPL